MGQISIARGVVAVDPTSGPGLPIYSDVTSPYVLYSGVGGLISGSSAFQWDNSNSTLKLGTGAKFDLYNTADQTTNYERLRAAFTANDAQLYTQAAGTGTNRNIRIGTGSGTNIARYLEIIAAGASTQRFNFVGADASPSGTHTFLNVVPTFNQSGTAGYTALDINPTETATGSGTKLLQRWAVGGSALGSFTNNGVLSAIDYVATGSITIGTSLGVAGDVRLFRDTADTLALRRSTNAQTFRVYNTYTDASNYERGVASWVSNQWFIGTESAGTGSARALVLSSGNQVRFSISGTVRWNVNSSGHFIAEADNTYDIGASGANRPRNLYVGGLGIFGTYYGGGIFTVAALAAAAGIARGRAFVSDSTVAAAGNFGAIVAGGGANTVPVYSDGTNWRIG